MKTFSSIQSVRRAAAALALLLVLLETSSARSAAESLGRRKTRHVLASLEQELSEERLSLGAPIFIRIFKESRELELWVDRGERYSLFKVYPICALNPKPGPKLKRGDWRSPEGFYRVGRSQLKPDSDYHLALNVGYPNSYDRAQGRSGSALMIHGDCVTAGCFAMDEHIDEIYALAEASTSGGREIPVHIFPFRMTDDKLRDYRHSPWHSFWQNLKVGYDLFEQSKTPPAAAVMKKRYVFGQAGG